MPIIGRGRKSIHYLKGITSSQINYSDIDKIFVVGKSILETYKFVKKDKQGKILKNTKEIEKLIKNHINDNDFLMIKGSNATGLNDFAKKLKKGKIN